jgi:hypothetical protein
MTKAGAATGGATSGGATGGGATGGGATGGGAKTRPREVTGAFAALVVTAVATLLASASLFGLNSWLRYQLAKSYYDHHKHKTISASDLVTQVHNAKVGGAQQAVIAVLALAFVAYGVWRGRSWARWGTFGVWALGSFSGMVFGVFSLLSIGASAPLAYKAPAFVAALAMLAAVLLTNMRPATAHFAANRPVRDGAPVRRGLFGPRPSPALRGRTPATTRTATATATATADTTAVKPERGRSKQRAESAAVSRGAELARTRAKAASKSRRRADA